MKSPLWLCLYFPLLPLEVFTRTHASHARPFAVTEASRIVAHDQGAAAAGITKGMSMATALSLSERLLLHERQPTHEEELLRSLADWAFAFSSELSLQPPDKLLLEIGASLKLFGGPASLLLRMESELRERGHRHCSGIAPTPAAAALLARARPCTHADIPDWCLDADRKLFLAAIAELPLELLDCTPRQLARMQRMGFSRVGGLLRLPAAALGRRFGAELAAMLRRLDGELPDPRPAFRPRDFFHSERHFLEPVADSTMLLFPARHMLRELDRFLERRQSHCQRLDWHLRTQGGGEQVLRIPCSLQHNNSAALFELTRIELQKPRPGDALISMALCCRHHARVHQRNRALFAEAGHYDPDTLRLLLDKLAMRLGHGSIHIVHPVDAHPPEQAGREMVGQPLPVPLSERSTSCITRPFWLLHQPQALQRRGQEPYWNGRLRLLRGPERIEDSWWTEHRVRDYFIAQNENGVLCWIYRERQDGGWFLHGLFG